MRVDIFLKLIGVFRTRSASGKACSLGHVMAGGRSVKPSHQVSRGDVLHVERPDGSELDLEVTDVPQGRQVPRKERDSYFRKLGNGGRWS